MERVQNVQLNINSNNKNEIHNVSKQIKKQNAKLVSVTFIKVWTTPRYNQENE